MNPDASTLAAGGPVDLDICKIEPGQQVVVRWRERPIFVFHRTPDTIKMLQDPKLMSRTVRSELAEIAAGAVRHQRHRSIKPEFGVLVGICTHLGCIPMFYPQPSAEHAGLRTGSAAISARATARNTIRPAGCFSGVPAPYNLPVPPYTFVSDTTIRIGENPSGCAWDFGSIRQLYRPARTLI